MLFIENAIDNPINNSASPAPIKMPFERLVDGLGG
jgi:hypothetical protein